MINKLKIDCFAKMCQVQIELHITRLVNKKPLLVIDFDNAEAKNNADIFDQLLDKLDSDLEHRLIKLLDEEIVRKYTIKNNLETKIRNLFANQSEFLNKFFDETSVEKITEIRIPAKYPISKGLIGIYLNH